MRYVVFNAVGRVELAVNDLTIDDLPLGAVELNELQWDRRHDLLLVDDEIAYEPLIASNIAIEDQRAGMVVKRGQGRIALHNAGLLQQVEDYINHESTDPVIRIAYLDALEWHRLSATTDAIKEVLQLTDSEVDDLFTAAAAVQY